MRRVVVTGLGIVSSLGNPAEEVLASLKAGKSGITANAAMNARDRALWSMGLSAARIALVYVPLAWVGVMVAGYPGILAAAVLANLAAVWGALVLCQAVGLLDLKLPGVSGPARRLQPAD